MNILNYAEITCITGGIRNYQLTSLITTGVSIVGDAVLHVACEKFNVDTSRFVTSKIAIPFSRVLTTYLGYEVGNYLAEDEHK